MAKAIILLKTILLSTSQINIYKYCNDKKKKRRVRASFIGMFCIYAMVMGYSFASSIGYGLVGLTEATPVLCALLISILAFIFTFFKTNGYLFNFKEYDMLMSLPFESRTVAACKFLYMYFKALPWYLSISLAMMVGYGITAKPIYVIYPIWFVLSFFLPIIPMLIASFFGFIIAKVSSGFKKTNFIQTVLTIIFVIFCFSLRFIIESIAKNGQIQDTLEASYEMTEKIAGIYLPAKWFSYAVSRASIFDMLLLIVVSCILFALVFYIVGNSYSNINSALKSHAASKNFKMVTLKKRSVIYSIAFKEFKRMTASTAYMVNVGMGEILTVILGVMTLIVGFDRIIKIIIRDAPLDPSTLQPAIPFIIYFLVGMVSSTACSPSLEGKQYWILQSLPIEKKTIYQGKMLYNMYLTVPFMSFGIICLCISLHVPIFNLLLYLILGFALCAFSTTWGCVCGIKHMRLDWENEVEVIKQGAAVALYMIPNMFVVMGLVVGVVFLGMHIPYILLTVIFIFVVAVLSTICYFKVLALTKCV